MHVAIIEPSHSGHRLTHLGLLIAAADRLGVDFTVATSPEAVTCDAWRVQVAPVLGSRPVQTSFVNPAGLGFFEYARRTLACMKQFIKDAKPDHLLIPYADGLSQAAGLARMGGLLRWPRDLETEAQLFRGGFAYRTHPSLKERVNDFGWLTTVAAAPWTTIHHLDPYIAQAMKERSRSLARRVRQIPDPVDPIPAGAKHEAQQRLGLPPGRRWIGCVGVIDRRKGCDTLLHAFRAAREQGLLAEHDCLLLVGHHDQAVLDLLRGGLGPLVASGSIVSMNRYVSDEELMSAISAMDLVCTPYPNQVGSSSIIIRAAAQDRPVLATDFGWMGRIVPSLRLGWTCPVDTPPQLAEAMGRCIDQAAAFHAGEAARRFVAYHAVSNYAAHWVRRICERLGREAPPRRDWSWVLEAAGARG